MVINITPNPTIEAVDLEPVKKFTPWRGWQILATLFIVAFVAINYWLFFSAPADFPLNRLVRIEKGLTVSQVANFLEREHAVRYGAMMKVILKLYPGQAPVKAGNYLFRSPLGVLGLSWRLYKGIYSAESYRVVIFEGSTNQDIAQTLSKALPFFQPKVFLSIASTSEGQLFPDTYFFPPTASEEDIVNRMKDNFSNKIRPYIEDIDRSGHTLSEIVTMASLIEKETRTPESRRLVSDILWSRIKAGMRLQVDAVFAYIMNKYSLQLTKQDLNNSSPYNTYKYAGLPPGPICNPGLDSIVAAIKPTKNDYLYYLSDRAGNIYYAKTFAEHKANKAKYLNN